MMMTDIPPPDSLHSVGLAQVRPNYIIDYYTSSSTDVPSTALATTTVASTLATTIVPRTALDTTTVPRTAPDTTTVSFLNVSVGPAVGGAVGGVIVLLLLAVIVCVVIVLIWQHHKRPQHKGTAIGNMVYEGAGTYMK